MFRALLYSLSVSSRRGEPMSWKITHSASSAKHCTGNLLLCQVPEKFLLFQLTNQTATRWVQGKGREERRARCWLMVKKCYHTEANGRAEGAWPWSLLLSYLWGGKVPSEQQKPETRNALLLENFWPSSTLDMGGLCGWWVWISFGRRTRAERPAACCFWALSFLPGSASQLLL